MPGFMTVIWFHSSGLSGGHWEIPQGLREKGFAITGVDIGCWISSDAPCKSCRLYQRCRRRNCVDRTEYCEFWRKSQTNCHSWTFGRWSPDIYDRIRQTMVGTLQNRSGHDIHGPVPAGGQVVTYGIKSAQHTAAGRWPGSTESYSGRLHTNADSFRRSRTGNTGP